MFFSGPPQNPPGTGDIVSGSSEGVENTSRLPATTEGAENTSRVPAATEGAERRGETAQEAAEQLLTPQDIDGMVDNFKNSFGGIGGWLMERGVIKEETLRSVFLGKEQCILTSAAAVLIGGRAILGVKGVRDSLGPIGGLVAKWSDEIKGDLAELGVTPDEEQPASPQGEQPEVKEEGEVAKAEADYVEWGADDFGRHITRVGGGSRGMEFPGDINKPVKIEFEKDYVVEGGETLSITLGAKDELVLPEGVQLNVDGREITGGGGGTKFNGERGEVRLTIVGRIPTGVVLKGRPEVSLERAEA